MFDGSLGLFAGRTKESFSPQSKIEEAIVGIKPHPVAAAALFDTNRLLLAQLPLAIAMTDLQVAKGTGRLEADHGSDWFCGRESNRW